jgi:hypothetical protein
MKGTVFKRCQGPKVGQFSEIDGVHPNLWKALLLATGFIRTLEFKTAGCGFFLLATGVTLAFLLTGAGQGRH